MVRTPPTWLQRQKVDQRLTLGPGYGEFRADYEPILARIARSQSHTRSGGAGGGARAAIVDHGNPGAWHGTSASAPATTVPCTNDAEVIEGVVGALDSHEFVFARLMTLADALGCMWACALFYLLYITSPDFRSEANSILRSLQGSRQRRAQMAALVQKTQKPLATTPPQ